MRSANSLYKNEILNSFAVHLLTDVSERQDNRGRKPKRGSRRKVPIQSLPQVDKPGFDICWLDNHRCRGTDFPWRLALAVFALEVAGFSNWNACVEVAEQLLVKQRLCSTSRGRKSKTARRDRGQENDTERVRSMVNGYRRNWEIDWDAELERWLSTYRFAFHRDEEWYAEAVKEYGKRARRLRLLGRLARHKDDREQAKIEHVRILLTLIEFHHERGKVEACQWCLEEAQRVLNNYSGANTRMKDLLWGWTAEDREAPRPILDSNGRIIMARFLPPHHGVVLPQNGGSGVRG